MRVKKAGIFYLILLGIFLFAFLPSASAADTCLIKLKSQCTGSQYPLLGLSTGSNAHGELYSENNYLYALCCNFGNGIQANECTSGTEVLKLSSATNAHAQTSSLSTYANKICYQKSGFDCQTITSGSCPTGYNAILSLSSETNAHIGTPGSYGTKICCNVRTVPPVCGNGVLETENSETCDDGNTANGDGCSSTCIIEPHAYWSLSAYGSPIISTEVMLGTTTLYMIIDNPGIEDGSAVTFEVYEDDDTSKDDKIRTTATNNSITGSVVDEKAIASVTLTQTDWDWAKASELADDVTQEYYFRVGSIGITSGNLDVTKSVVCGNSIIETGETCDDGNTAPGDGCSSTCQIDHVCGNSIIETGETCDDGNTANGDGCSSVCVWEPDAYWSTSSSGSPRITSKEVILGETPLYMIIEHSPFLDGTKYFNVFEDDTFFDDDIRTIGEENAVRGTVTGGKAVSAPLILTDTDWTKADDGADDIEQEYYFNIEGIQSYDLIVTKRIGPQPCLNTNLCSDYTDSASCVADSCGVADASVDPPGIATCSTPNYSCGCWWNPAPEKGTSNCQGNYSIGPACGDGVINTGETCDTGLVDPIDRFGGLTCSDFDTFTGGGLTCDPVTCTIDTSQCTGGTPGVCGDSVINTGETCDTGLVDPIDRFGGLTCPDFDTFTGGGLTCDPVTCDILTNTCTGGVDANPGTCQVTQDTAKDDCADGFLSFSWTGVWVGDRVSGDEDEKCELGGADTIACPSRVQLPFFGTGSVIAVIILAIIIYLIISLRRNRNPSKTQFRHGRVKRRKK
jgi:cysteine-rich repeat protein